MKFDISLVGRIEINVKLSSANLLLPLFEAISNSMHAIDDANEKNALIVIRIHRNTEQKLLDFDDQKAVPPVSGFSVEDNGIGFTSANFKSFCTADSLYKRTRGGKGVGRFFWLKAFERIRVESVFQENGKWFRREFEFVLKDEPIPDASHTVVEVPSGPSKTIVELQNYRTAFKEGTGFKNFETIARKTIEHFLTFFVQETCPVIELHDEYLSEKDTLNRFFDEEMKLERTDTTFSIASRQFTLQHFRIRTSAQRPVHSIHLCAHGRSVEEIPLADQIPVLTGALADTETGSKFVYMGYLTSSALDNNVSQDRTHFDLPARPGSLITNGEEVSMYEIVRDASKQSERFLEPFLNPVREQQLQRVAEFAQKHPRYRPIVKLRPTWVQSVRADLKDEDLDIEMFKLSQRMELEVRREGVALKQDATDGLPTSVESRKEHLQQYITDWNAISISKLAEYVLHRRTTLDFLHDCMKVGDDGKFVLEDVIHELIFPMKETSDTVSDPDQNNLWIIDERLSYHVYLASDKQMQQIDPIQIDGDGQRDRMDLFILRQFDVPHAFVDSERPFQSITIIELKRPMREGYDADDESDNPIRQVWGYVTRLRGGRMKDRTGQFVNVNPNTPFYAFIICTLTPKMMEIANTEDFTPTPDGLGFFHWHRNLKIYTEVISYRKLIRDARDRNQVLFDKLNLPGHSIV